MRIFITGATGYIGRALIEDFVRAGHEVRGLTRTAEKKRLLETLGALPVVGDLRDPSAVSDAAASADAVVHAAFDRTPDGAAIEQAAVGILLDLLASQTSPRHFVYTSGVLVLGNTGDKPAYEDSSTDGAPRALAWRPPLERRVLNAGGGRLTTAVVRPGFVWGEKGGNFAMWFKEAEEKGAVEVVGDGNYRRAYIHREDLAELYRFIIEEKAEGIFHGVDGLAVRVQDAAKLCSQIAGNGAVKKVPLEEARKKWGDMADARCCDQVIETQRSLKLDWSPARPRFPESVAVAYGEWKGRKT